MLEAPELVSATVAVHVEAWFTATEAGEHTTDVELSLLATVRAELPKLAECDPSPPYDAVIVSEPGAGGVYEMVQEPADDRVQVPPLLKLPPAPLSSKVTVPVGTLEPPESVSAMVAVSVMEFPNTTEEGLGETEVSVVRVLTTMDALPDVIVTGTPEVSVTSSSNDQVPIVVRAPVEVVGVLLIAQENEVPKLLYPFAPGALWSH